MKSDVTEDTSDTLTIKTQSSYGQYEVDPVTSENSPLSKLSAKAVSYTHLTITTFS